MNILVHEGRLLITDLGLSQPLDFYSNSLIGGMVTYTDLEYLKNLFTYRRNKASDIYGLGILFWELSSGKPPFNNLNHNEICNKVISGERKKPVHETPVDYISIYSSAWDDCPDNRPTIEDICKSLRNVKLDNIYINYDYENDQLANVEEISMGIFVTDTISFASSAGKFILYCIL